MNLFPGEIKMKQEQININNLKRVNTFDIILSPIMAIYQLINIYYYLRLNKYLSIK